jgi:hypothetical protein
MTEKTKRKVKINVIDILIILLVVALIATVIYRVYTGVNDDKSPMSSKYVITFECEDYNSLVSYLKKGEAVYFAENGRLLGNMYAPKGSEGAAFVVADDERDGNKKDFTYTVETIRGYISLTGDAVKSKTADYYSIGDMNVTVGSIIEVYTNEAQFTLTVKSIDAK